MLVATNEAEISGEETGKWKKKSKWYLCFLSNIEQSFARISELKWTEALWVLLCSKRGKSALLRVGSPVSSRSKPRERAAFSSFAKEHFFWGGNFKEQRHRGLLGWVQWVIKNMYLFAPETSCFPASSHYKDNHRRECYQCLYRRTGSCQSQCRIIFKSKHRVPVDKKMPPMQSVNL